MPREMPLERMNYTKKLPTAHTWGYNSLKQQFPLSY